MANIDNIKLWTMQYGKGKELFGLCFREIDVFENPRDLSDFKTPEKPYHRIIDRDGSLMFIDGYESGKPLKRAPQGWQYVEEKGMKAFCPFCEKEYNNLEVQTRYEITTLNGVTAEWQKKYIACPDCGEELYNAELHSSNLRVVYAACKVTDWYKPVDDLCDFINQFKSDIKSIYKDSELKYNGYHTYIHYSVADKVLYGKIEDIKDLVNFESESATEIENEFHKAVDDYIAFCSEVEKNVEEDTKNER